MRERARHRRGLFVLDYRYSAKPTPLEALFSYGRAAQRAERGLSGITRLAVVSVGPR